MYVPYFFIAVVILQYLDRLVAPAIDCQFLSFFASSTVCGLTSRREMFSVWSSLASHHFFRFVRGCKFEDCMIHDLDRDSWHWFLDENQSVKHLICSKSKFFSRKVFVSTHLSTSCFPLDRMCRRQRIPTTIHSSLTHAEHELCCHGCAQLEFSRFRAPESWQQS